MLLDSYRCIVFFRSFFQVSLVLAIGTQAGGLYCLSPHLGPAIGYNDRGKRWP